MVDVFAYVFAWAVLIACAASCVYAWRRALFGRDPNGATTKPVPGFPVDASEVASSRPEDDDLPDGWSKSDVYRALVDIRSLP